MSKSVEITHKELKQFIDEVWGTKISLNLTGTVGIGKSVAVYEKSTKLADKVKREFVDWNRVSKQKKKDVINNPSKYLVFMDIRLSQFDSTDLKGLPKIDSEEVVEWLIQNWLYALTKEDLMAVVFFDELNLAPNSVQASAYQIIRDRCAGDVKLGDNVCVISAGNTLEDRANVFEMAKPLCNRFIHATLMPPVINPESNDGWDSWAIEHDVDSRIITYLQFEPKNLFNFDAESPEDAFPTPRSWAEYVSPLIKGKDHNHPLFQKLVASAVGSGCAISFTAFCRLEDKIDFKEILNKPKKIKDIEQIDIRFALTGIVDNWFDNNHGKEDCVKLLELVSQMEAEFSILTLKMCFKKHKEAMKKYFGSIKLWTEKLSKEYSKYLIAE